MGFLRNMGVNFWQYRQSWGPPKRVYRDFTWHWHSLSSAAQRSGFEVDRPKQPLDGDTETWRRNHSSGTPQPNGRRRSKGNGGVPRGGAWCETGCVRGRGSGLLVEASGVYIPHGNGGNVRHPSPLIDAPIKFKRFIGFGLVGRGDGATDALRSLVNETRRLGAG